MIDLLIYHIHIVAIVYAFTKRWQEDGVKSGLMAVVLCSLVFIIIWSLMGPLARLIMPAPKAGDLFSVDTLSLLFTMVPESIFYWRFFLSKSTVESKVNPTPSAGVHPVDSENVPRIDPIKTHSADSMSTPSINSKNISSTD